MHYIFALLINLAIVIFFFFMENHHFNFKLNLFSIVITSVIMAFFFRFTYSFNFIDKKIDYWEENFIVYFVMYFISLIYFVSAYHLIILMSSLSDTDKGYETLFVLFSVGLFVAYLSLSSDVEQIIRKWVLRPVSEMDFKKMFQQLVLQLKVATSNDAELLAKASKAYDRIIEEKLRGMRLYEQCMQSDNQLLFLNNNVPKFRLLLKRILKQIKKEIV